MKRNEIEIEKDYAVIVIESKKYGVVKSKIDKDDIQLLKNYCWCVNHDKKLNSFYIATNIKIDGVKKLIKLHRLIMNTPKDLQVDHINRDTTDNRRLNLRNCTSLINNKNRGRHKRNKSGITGVSYNKTFGKWCVYIGLNKKLKYLGAFETKEQAQSVREKAEKELYICAA